MQTTSRDYAPKQYLDPVSEVEREALQKGFIRGCFFTVAIFLATFVAMEAVIFVGNLVAGVL